MPYLRLSGAALLMALSSVAHPASVSIVNAGFEEPYVSGNLPPEFNGIVPPGAFPTGSAPNGWTAFGQTPGASVGVLNPGTFAPYTFFPAGAPEGNNVALLYMDGPNGGQPYGIYQELTETLRANTTYTLTVEVGNIASGTGGPPFDTFGPYDLGGFPGYQVQLRANGVILEQDNSTLTPGEGLFELSTVPFTTGGNVAPNQFIEIRLISLNGPGDPAARGVEVDFDDVRLDASPVPLPPPALLLLSALLALTPCLREAV